MKTPTMALLAVVLATPAGAWAQQTPAALYTQSLAATCANCHGTAGKTVEGSSVPALAGLETGYFVAQMKAFRVGSRPATVMHQISKGFSDAQVESLAGYFAAQKK
jgi:sulfide dehydrogenase cytochrome subunit